MTSAVLDQLYDQPPKWEMVTMKRAEVDSMRKIIKYQDQKIRDMTDRCVRTHIMQVGHLSSSEVCLDKAHVLYVSSVVRFCEGYNI